MRRSLPFVLPLLIAAAPAGALAQVTVDPNALQKLGGAALPAPPAAAAPHATGRALRHGPRHRHNATGHKSAIPSTESATPAAPGKPATGPATGGPPPGITLAPGPPPLPPAVGQPGKPVPLPVIPPPKPKEKTKPIAPPQPATPPTAQPAAPPPAAPPPAAPQPAAPQPVAPKPVAPVAPAPTEEAPALPAPTIPPPAAMPLPGAAPEKGGVPATAGATLPPAPTVAPPLPAGTAPKPATPTPAPSSPAAPAGVALPPGTQALTLPLAAGDTDLPAAEQSMLRDFAHGRALNSPLYTIRAFATAPADDNDPSTPRRIALSRARAVQEALIAAGVPGDHIRLLALGAAGGSPPDRIEILASPPTH